jgi:hypothetical protein
MHRVPFTGEYLYFGLHSNNGDGCDANFVRWRVTLNKGSCGGSAGDGDDDDDDDFVPVGDWVERNGRMYLFV